MREGKTNGETRVEEYEERVSTTRSVSSGKRIDSCVNRTRDGVPVTSTTMEKT